MKKFQDILTDENGELLFASGDIVVGDSDESHIEDILKASPGIFKQFPLLGANINSMLNGEIDVEQRRKIRLHLESDGYSVKNVSFNNDVLDIEAER